MLTALIKTIPTDADQDQLIPLSYNLIIEINLNMKRTKKNKKQKNPKFQQNPISNMKLIT